MNTWVDKLAAARAEVERLRAENAQLKGSTQYGHVEWLNGRLERAERRMAELEAENAKLRKDEENYNADMEEELNRRADFDKLLAFKQLVHSRLDVMGVPSCEEVDCQCVKVHGTPGRSGPYLCDLCNGTGKRLVENRIAARLDWVAALFRELSLDIHYQNRFTRKP